MDMQGDRQIGAREPRVQSVTKHGVGARDDLFRRLADQHQGSAPLVAHGRHDPGGADHGCEMKVVPARVGHGRGPAGEILHHDRGRIGQTAQFLDW